MDTATLLQKCKEKYPDAAATDPKELRELYPRIQSVSIWRPTFFLKGNNQRRGGERGVEEMRRNIGTHSWYERKGKQQLRARLMGG